MHCQPLPSAADAGLAATAAAMAATGTSIMRRFIHCSDSGARNGPGLCGNRSRRPRCQASFPLFVKHPCQLTGVSYYTCATSRYGKLSWSRPSRSWRGFAACCPPTSVRARTGSSARDTASGGSSRGRRCGSLLCARLGVRARGRAAGRQPSTASRSCSGTRLRFNLSHSGTLAVVALADDLEVGVDVERPGRNAAAVERTLSEGERASGDDLLQLWCRKEALGEGDRAAACGWAPEAFDTTQVDGYALADLALAGGYVGALAVEGERRGPHALPADLLRDPHAQRALGERVRHEGPLPPGRARTGRARTRRRRGWPARAGRLRSLSGACRDRAWCGRGRRRRTRARPAGR